MRQWVGLAFLMACEPGKGVSNVVDDILSEEGDVLPDEVPLDTAADQEEPSMEPGSEPAQEPASEPTDEPAEEEIPPPTVFSEFVEDKLGLARGSSGLDSVDANVKLWLDASLVTSSRMASGRGGISMAFIYKSIKL